MLIVIVVSSVFGGDKIIYSFNKNLESSGMCKTAWYVVNQKKKRKKDKALTLMELYVTVRRRMLVKEMHEHMGSLWLATP